MCHQLFTLVLLRNENCFISSWSLWVRNSERAQQEWLVLVPQFLELPSFWEDLKAQGEARDGGRSHQKGSFTHTSAAWAGKTGRLGLLMGVPTSNPSMGATVSGLLAFSRGGSRL